MLMRYARRPGSLLQFGISCTNCVWRPFGIVARRVRGCGSTLDFVNIVNGLYGPARMCAKFADLLPRTFDLQWQLPIFLLLTGQLYRTPLFVPNGQREDHSRRLDGLLPA